MCLITEESKGDWTGMAEAQFMYLLWRTPTLQAWKQGHISCQTLDKEYTGKPQMDYFRSILYISVSGKLQNDQNYLFLWVILRVWQIIIQKILFKSIIGKMRHDVKLKYVLKFPKKYSAHNVLMFISYLQHQMLQVMCNMHLKFVTQRSYRSQRRLNWDGCSQIYVFFLWRTPTLQALEQGHISRQTQDKEMQGAHNWISLDLFFTHQWQTAKWSRLCLFLSSDKSFTNYHLEVLI